MIILLYIKQSFALLPTAIARRLPENSIDTMEKYEISEKLRESHSRRVSVTYVCAL